jgi:hypothetical protein
MTPPAHPFDIVFTGIAETRFPALRAACGDAPELAEFLVARPAIELLQDLRPEEGIGEAIDDFVAFVHAAYRYWAAGARTATVDERVTRTLCRPHEDPASSREMAPAGAMYIQVAPRIIWGQLMDGASYEPLDGWFAMPGRDRLHVVACFGVHPDRPGLSVLAIDGERPEPFARPDGTPLFAPTMAGGREAGLHAVAGPLEMLLLAWRAVEFMEVG